jgi:hypothetical protein
MREMHFPAYRRGICPEHLADCSLRGVAGISPNALSTAGRLRLTFISSSEMLIEPLCGKSCYFFQCPRFFK